MHAIFVFGGIGAGKTTVATALASTLGIPLVREPVDENPFLPLYALDRARWALTCQTYYYLQYVREYERTLANSSLQTMEPDTPASESTVVIDAGAPTNRYVYARYMREHGLVTVDEYALYETLARMMDAQFAYPEPSSIVYVDVPADEAMRRLRARGREFELAGHTGDYVRAISGYTKEMREVYRARGVPVHAYDNSGAAGRARSLESLIAKLSVETAP